ncbi:MAG: hypothetical protein M2R45_03996 [Verrucomicrobia subdivision 3 bacterium]|nr:hypothetical protein [Limisphaerales bacterium]
MLFGLVALLFSFINSNLVPNECRNVQESVEVIQSQLERENLRNLRAQEDLKAVEESLGSLRQLMWGATGKNRRAIENIQNVLSIQERADDDGEAPTAKADDGNPPDFIPCCGGDEEIEDVSNASLDSPDMQAKVAEVAARLKEQAKIFRASLDDEGRGELARRTDELMDQLYYEPIQRIPIEFRGRMMQVTEAQKEDMRKGLEESVAFLMMTEDMQRQIFKRLDAREKNKPQSHE